MGLYNWMERRQQKKKTYLAKQADRAEAQAIVRKDIATQVERIKTARTGRTAAQRKASAMAQKAAHDTRMHNLGTAIVGGIKVGATALAKEGRRAQKRTSKKQYDPLKNMF